MRAMHYVASNVLKEVKRNCAFVFLASFVLVRERILSKHRGTNPPCCDNNHWNYICQCIMVYILTE